MVAEHELPAARRRYLLGPLQNVLKAVLRVFTRLLGGIGVVRRPTPATGRYVRQTLL